MRARVEYLLEQWQPDGAVEMVWYVALVAILNLGLGYLLARFLAADAPADAWPLDDSPEWYEAAE